MKERNFCASAQYSRSVCVPLLCNVNTRLSPRTPLAASELILNAATQSSAKWRIRLTRHKMSDGGRGHALLGVKVSIAWLGLCGFIGGRGATIGAQLHNRFFAIIAIAHILSCKLESAFL